MRLSEYIAKVAGQKPYVWADAVGIPRSLVYAWLAGAKPSWASLIKIQKVTDGAVRLEDFN